MTYLYCDNWSVFIVCTSLFLMCGVTLRGRLEQLAVSRFIAWFGLVIS